MNELFSQGGIAPGTAVLVHSAGSVDLGELAVSRDLKSNENAL